MGRQLTKQKLAKTYRQFSRQKYNKYKHQFPRMRQSELVNKIIKEWEAMGSQEKKDLHQSYVDERHLNQDQGHSESSSSRNSPGRTPQQTPEKKTNKTKKIVKDPIFQSSGKKQTKSGVRVFIRQETTQKKESNFDREQCHPKRETMISYRETARQRAKQRKYDLATHRQKCKRNTFHEPREIVANTLGILDIQLFSFLKHEQFESIKPSLTPEIIDEINTQTIYRQFRQKTPDELRNKFDFINMFDCLHFKCKLCGHAINPDSATKLKFQMTLHLEKQHKQLYWALWRLNHWGKLTYYFVDADQKFTKGYVDLTAARKYQKDVNQKYMEYIQQLTAVNRHHEAVLKQMPPQYQLMTMKKDFTSKPLGPVAHKPMPGLYDRIQVKCHCFMKCHDMDLCQRSFIWVAKTGTDTLILCQVDGDTVIKCPYNWKMTEDGYQSTGDKVIPRLFAYMRQDIAECGPSQCAPDIFSHQSDRFKYIQINACKHHQSICQHRFIFPLYEYEDKSVVLELNHLHNFGQTVKLVRKLVQTQNIIQSCFINMNSFFKIIKRQLQQFPQSITDFQNCSTPSKLFECLSKSIIDGQQSRDGAQLHKIVLSLDRQKCVNYMQTFIRGWSILVREQSQCMPMHRIIKGGNVLDGFQWKDDVDCPIQHRLKRFYDIIQTNLSILDQHVLKTFKKFYPNKIQRISDYKRQHLCMKKLISEDMNESQ